MTSLSDRFEGLSVVYYPYRARRYPIDGVALSFINAMKLGALRDCDERLTSYTYTDTEYQDSDIRIRVAAEENAPQGQLVLCNILYAIKTVAIAQLDYAQEFGASFVESHHGTLLYRGILDNKFDVPLLQQSSNPTADISDKGSQEKRALVLDSTNATTTLLNITGSNNVEYNLEFYYSGILINKVSIFSAILEFMMTLADRGGDAGVEHVSEVKSADTYWMFVMRIQDSSFPLQVFQVAAILEAMAQYCVTRSHYQEMSFRFFVNHEYTAHGCLTAPLPSRRWCAGMR